MMHIPRHQKTYLSREMTRAMALDHPIGDPHGGPAYGERNDPVSAIISIGTMFAAGGGFAAAGFSLASMSLASGLAFAGGALGLLGNITGNKTLSKIGMIAGIAGGLGNLFEIGTSSTVGDLFGLDKAAASGAPGAALASTPNPAAGADVSGAILDSGGVVTSPVSVAPPPQGFDPNPLAGTEFAGPVNDVTASLAGSQTPIAPSADLFTSSPLNASNAGVGFDPSAPMAPGAPTAGVNAPTVPTTEQMLSTANASTDPMGSLLQQKGVTLDPNYAATVRPMTTGESMWQGVKSMGKSWMDMAKTNPAMATMMGNTISSVADVISGKADAQVNALEAQGQLSKAQADKLRFEMEEYKRKIAQQNSNYANVANPLASWQPPAAQGYTPMPTAPTGGIIGGAMQPGG